MRMAVVCTMAVAMSVIMIVIMAVLMPMRVRVQCGWWRHLRIRNPVVTIESNPLSGCES